jgi:hypothetical protein
MSRYSTVVKLIVDDPEQTKVVQPRHTLMRAGFIMPPDVRQHAENVDTPAPKA